MDRLRDKKYSTAQAAGLLGVTGRQVVDLIHEGELVAYRIGRKYVLCEADLMEFLNTSRVTSPTPRRTRPPKRPVARNTGATFQHLKL
jgi:excisionase family DNA binding protein